MRTTAKRAVAIQAVIGLVALAGTATVAALLAH